MGIATHCSRSVLGYGQRAQWTEHRRRTHLFRVQFQDASAMMKTIFLLLSDQRPDYECALC